MASNQLDVLAKFIPKLLVKEVLDYLEQNDVRLTITKKRVSKLGDYRAPNPRQNYHRVSVNGSLNQYAFLITLIHEFAHLDTYKKYKNRVKPHGKEWKLIFSNKLIGLISRNIFPTDISKVLYNYALNPKASSCSDEALIQILRKYDNGKNLTLSQIEEGEKFRLGKRIFEKGKKKRVRYLCRESSTNQYFMISGLAEVTKTSDEH